jgi:16S rRNA (uracil1498-N3)-methyltransferase
MAVHDFKSQRVFVENDLQEGAAFEASREQANYLLNVLRLNDGDELLTFNGHDGEWRCSVKAQGRKKCSLTPQEQTRPQPEPYSLIYCFAPLKQARLDYMVQKAVEMGVGVLQPVITEYTQVRNINPKRMRANAIEAAEQCGILTLPELKEPIKLTALNEILGETLLVFCDEDAPHERPYEILKHHQGKPISLLIGPEGGFSPNERDLLRAKQNVVRLGLGPRILRADTAAIAALAIIQSKAGDW